MRAKRIRSRAPLRTFDVPAEALPLPPAASEAPPGAVAAIETTEAADSIVARVLGDGVASIGDANLLRRGIAEGWIGFYEIGPEVRGEMLSAARRMLSDAQERGSARATRAAIRLLRVLVRDNVALAQVDGELAAAQAARREAQQLVNVAIKFDAKG